MGNAEFYQRWRMKRKNILYDSCVSGVRKRVLLDRTQVSFLDKEGRRIRKRVVRGTGCQMDGGGKAGTASFSLGGGGGKGGPPSYVVLRCRAGGRKSFTHKKGNSRKRKEVLGDSGLLIQLLTYCQGEGEKKEKERWFRIEWGERGETCA